MENGCGHTIMGVVMLLRYSQEYNFECYFLCRIMYITLVFFCVYVDIACCHPQPETDGEALVVYLHVHVYPIFDVMPCV